MSIKKILPTVATIAGSDSCGGAGIQADIKTISALDCYAASIITTLTAQNTLGVQSILEISADFVQQQIDSVFTDLTVKAVKIGMLNDKTIIETVAQSLIKYKPKYIVLDPVMLSKSNYMLLKKDAVEYLQEILFPQVTLITPNLVEAEKLLTQKITNTRDMEAAAIQLGKKFNIGVLIKGGHLVGEQCSDVLYNPVNSECYWLHSPRINTLNTHGTGCTLSAAIAAFLALDYSIEQSFLLAKNYLTSAIQSASRFEFGKGCGPVNHFHSSTLKL